ncbi:MAG: hypothetical protein ACI8Z5_001537 [Lentimonas sp.]|jgi:hypothetical protein
MLRSRFLTAIEIDANEAIVVYNDQDGGAQRHIVCGPALHFPTADEWPHEFQWLGSQGANHEVKLAGALRFTKMRVIPDQMYFSTGKPFKNDVDQLNE